MKRWPEITAIYQIYPRSYYDSNNDGLGDINGIIEKLDYIYGKPDSLGANAIWISPFFPSPMADFGYDVSDYKDVDGIFGTLDDFRRLITEAHQRKIKVIVDFVPNHSSDEHPWFVESRQSKDNPKRDWYVWRDPKPDGSPPNNWLSVFGGSAWQFDETTGQYYLHTFLAKQPDLNWENKLVREAMCDVVDFWLDLGVDGIRADAVRWISKDPELRDNPLNPSYRGEGLEDPYHAQLQKYTRFGENLFPYLKELAQVVENYDDRIIIFEDYPDSSWNHIEQYDAFYHRINTEVGAPFIFDGMFLPYSSTAFQNFIYTFQAELGAHHRLFYCFGNHDQPRLASRFGRHQARLIALLQLTLPGIPVIYYGDEIGMTNAEITASEVQDPFELQTPGLGLGRDPQRTPMQWSDEPFAGFSTVRPWLPIGDESDVYNVQSEMNAEQSFLTFYQKLLQLRAQYEVLRTGEGYSQEVDNDHERFITYRYITDEIQISVIANMSDKPDSIPIAENQTIIISTHDKPEIQNGSLHLRPHEAVVLLLTK